MFNATIHRPKTIQRIRLGAGPEGHLTAIGHESWSGNLPGGRTEPTILATRSLYAGANRLTQARLATLDLAEGNAMRAPGEAPGLMALEVAMDELAERLRMDPVQLRIINDTQVDPEDPSKPFSTRPFVQCLREGSARFGWARRISSPGRTREGRWLLGLGMASAIRGAKIAKSGARARLDRFGVVTIETDMTDIGTGSYTIVQQTAAEVMGVTRIRSSSGSATPPSRRRPGLEVSWALRP